MIRFDKISATEKNYPFVDAVVAGDYLNGTFGTVSNGTFTAGATGFYAIMNIEDGSKAKSDEYVVNAGAHARIVDFSKVDGQILNVTSAQLPETFAKGNKLVSKEDGTLQVGSPTNKYFEVVEVTRFGANVKVVVG